MNSELVIKLKCSFDPKEGREFSLGEDVESLANMLYDVSVFMESQDGCKFSVYGFGEDWEPTLAPDLYLFLEDIFEAIDDIEADRPACLYFCDQELMRNLDVMPQGECVGVRCSSWGGFVPVPEEIVIKKQYLLDSLREVADVFTVFLSQLPKIRESEWYKEWMAMYAKDRAARKRVFE